MTTDNDVLTSYDAMRFLGYKCFADFLSCVRNGLIPAVKVGAKWKFSRKVLSTLSTPMHSPVPVSNAPPELPSQDDVLFAAEAAKLLRFKGTVNFLQLVRAGQIPGKKIGLRWFFSKRQLLGIVGACDTNSASVSTGPKNDGPVLPYRGTPILTVSEKPKI